MDTTAIALKAISKDLHDISMTLKDIDKKLGHYGQASIFQKKVPKYEYIPDDCPSHEPPDLAK